MQCIILADLDASIRHLIIWALSAQCRPTWIALICKCADSSIGNLYLRKRRWQIFISLLILLCGFCLHFVSHQERFHPNSNDREKSKKKRKEKRKKTEIVNLKMIVKRRRRVAPWIAKVVLTFVAIESTLAWEIKLSHLSGKRKPTWTTEDWMRKTQLV